MANFCKSISFSVKPLSYMQNTIMDTCNLLFDLIPLMLVFIHILKISKIICNKVVNHIPDIFLK